jgi:hypothetical protein
MGPRDRVHPMTRAGVLSLFLLTADLGCGKSARHPDGNCQVYIGEGCDLSSADVIVTAEIAVADDGRKRLTKVVSLQPPDSPLREKAIASAKQEVQGGLIGTSQTPVVEVPFCEHIPVQIFATGQCPARQTIEENARRKGYNVRSIDISP